MLHIDGNVASSRLASEFHVGSTVFKQDSFSSEYFYPLLRPWTHYVPVKANLQDVPERLAWARRNPRQAEAIAQNGKRFATRHLHKHAVACYWWQLLRAFAALQTFEPRTEGFKGLSTPGTPYHGVRAGRGRRKRSRPSGGRRVSEN